MAVPAGTYEFSLPVHWNDGDQSHGPLCKLEIVAGTDLLASRELDDRATDGETTLSCTATIPELRFAVHARLFCSGSATVEAPLTLAMSPDPWRA